MIIITPCPLPLYHTHGRRPDYSQPSALSMPPHMLVNTQLCHFPFQFKGILSAVQQSLISLVHSSSTLTRDSLFLSPQHFPSHPRSISISIALRKWKQSAENLYYHVSYQLAPASTHLLSLLLYDRPSVLQSKPLTPLTS